MTIVALTCIAAITVAAPTATGSHSQGKGPNEDFAVGTGANEDTRIAFNARGGPSPLEPVRGQFLARGQFDDLGLTKFRFKGPVTCLVVEGNRAGLFYPIRDADPEQFEDMGVFIFLEDNGPGQSGEPDRMGFVGPVPIPENPQACAPGPTPLEVERGNITIHDAD